ncbi:sel1 repeat family protein [Caenimonas sedimenti]|uniref:sel1 repeat family protein n=1 Tax=Caenimonas sedimenti TaxID=2596921 RepID=UPI0016460529|nr:M48 family metalloprotease [Caenimonas sedimenti]
MRALLLGVLLVAGSVHAQSWPAAAMLRETNSGTIALRTASGYTVGEVSRDQVQRTADVLERLAKVYGMETPHLYVTAAHAPNASASLRDGKPAIGITTGMLRIAGERDEYLAAVLGHELGHLHAGHGLAGRERSQIVTTFGVLVGAVVDIGLGLRGYYTGGAGAELGGLGANVVNAKFSRDQEHEADRLGTEAMAKAGYDPALAIGFWRQVAGTVSTGEGYWLNTHPPHAEREAELTARARELAPVFAQNRPKEEVTTSGVRETVILGTPLAPATEMQASAAISMLAPAAPVPAPAPRVRVTIPNADAEALGRQALQHLVGGNGQPRDHAKARAFGERATQAGDPVGKAVYGTVLREGLAGPANPVLGFQLLQEAAEYNVPWAHYQLGMAYRLGLGVAADRARALQHLSAAAPTIVEAQDLLSRIRAEAR